MCYFAGHVPLDPNGSTKTSHVKEYLLNCLFWLSIRRQQLPQIKRSPTCLTTTYTSTISTRHLYLHSQRPPVTVAFPFVTCSAASPKPKPEVKLDVLRDDSKATTGPSNRGVRLPTRASRLLLTAEHVMKMRWTKRRDMWNCGTVLQEGSRAAVLRLKKTEHFRQFRPGSAAVHSAPPAKVQTKRCWS